MAFLDKLKRMVQEPQSSIASSPRDESNALLNEAIQLALKLIEKHGSHIPFCLAITTTGERINFAPNDAQISDADVLFETVRQYVLKAIQEKRVHAIALARNVQYRRADDSTIIESIQVTIDHLRDRASTCYLPYQATQGRIMPGEIFATEPVEKFFTDKATFVAGPDGNIATR